MHRFRRNYTTAQKAGIKPTPFSFPIVLFDGNNLLLLRLNCANLRKELVEQVFRFLDTPGTPKRCRQRARRIGQRRRPRRFPYGARLSTLHHLTVFDRRPCQDLRARGAYRIL